MMASMEQPPRPAAVGETVGVEEEYHLVDTVTAELARRPAVAAAAAAGEFGAGIHGELQVSQLEVVTDVCRSLDDVRAALVAGRRSAGAAVSASGAALYA